MLIQVSQQDCCFSCKPRTGLPLLRLPRSVTVTERLHPSPHFKGSLFFLILTDLACFPLAVRKVPDILNFVTGGARRHGREDTLCTFSLRSGSLLPLFLMLRLSSALDFISKSQSKKTEVNETLSCCSPWLCSFRCSGKSHMLDRIFIRPYYFQKLLIMRC